MFCDKQKKETRILFEFDKNLKLRKKIDRCLPSLVDYALQDELEAS